METSDLEEEYRVAKRILVLWLFLSYAYAFGQEFYYLQRIICQKTRLIYNAFKVLFGLIIRGERTTL